LLSIFLLIVVIISRFLVKKCSNVRLSSRDCWCNKMCVNHRMGVHANQKAIAPLLLLILVAALLVAAYAAISQLQPHQLPPIEIKEFGIQPSAFKADEEGQLSIGMESLSPTDLVNVTIYFETHQNVKVYQGNSLLRMAGSNYTLVKLLDPSESTKLKFAIRGSIDVGDNSRNYYLRAYFYVGDAYFAVRSAAFTINSS
jgi:hypothetical protein